MPIYIVACRDCGAEKETWAPIQLGKSSTSCDCGSVMRRRYTPPAFHTDWQAGYNHSVGRYCGTRREFEDALKEGSERMSATMGFDTNYVPVHPGDMKPLNDGEGLEETLKKRRDSGQSEATSRIFG